MIFVIAVIKVRGMITSFKLLDTDTNKVEELGYNSTKQVNVSNLKLVGDRLKGYGGSLDRYTTIYPNEFNVKNKESIVILGIIRREKEDMYLCSDCNGNTREFKVRQLINYKRNIEQRLGIYAYSIANGKIVENRIQSIEGSYNVIATISQESEDKAKEIQNKINQYNAKAKLMGITPMKFEVKDNMVKLVEAYGSHTIPPFVNIIGKGVYAGDAKMTVINLPENLIKIEERAFMSCRELKTVNGGNIKIIEQSAFNDCLKLESINLGGTRIIGRDAFEACKSLAKIDLNSATEIDSAAFFYCGNLKSVGRLEKIRSLADRAFCGCSSLESIDISGDIKNISTATFYNCINIRKVRILSNIEKIYDSAFQDCVKLDTVELPESLNEIGHTAFNRCTSLKNIKIPNNVKAIGHSAFSGCGMIESINLNHNITSIENYAFAHTGIKELAVPAHIKSIGESAFYGSKLRKVTFNTPVELGNTAFSCCNSLVEVKMPLKMRLNHNKKAFDRKLKINTSSNLGIIGRILGI